MTELRPDPGSAPVAAPLPEGVVVRAARPRDASSFVGMWRRVVAEGNLVRTEHVTHPARYYRRSFGRSWSDAGAELVAVRRGRVIGHLSIRREEHPVTRHVATLGIAVDSAWRGRGVGTALMVEAFRWGRSVGVERIMLSVFPHNERAIALYRRFGFVEEGRLVKHSRKAYGYEDEILMAAWIGGSQG